MTDRITSSPLRLDEFRARPTRDMTPLPAPPTVAPPDEATARRWAANDGIAEAVERALNAGMTLADFLGRADFAYGALAIDRGMHPDGTR